MAAFLVAIELPAWFVLVKSAEGPMMITTQRTSSLLPRTIWAAVLIANLAIACFLYTTVGWHYIRGYREVTTFLIYPAIGIQAGVNLVVGCAFAGISLWQRSKLVSVAGAHLAAALLLPISLPIAPLVGSALKDSLILRTSIVDAAAYQDTELVKVLLHRGADPNTRGRPGLNATALHFMASGGKTEVVELLLQKGADPNARANLFHEYPLHGAVSNRAPLSTIRALLMHGADPKLRDRKGRTALDLAYPGEGSLLRAALRGTPVDKPPRDAPMMTDADTLTVKLRETLGSTRIEEQWNETLVMVNFSAEGYDSLKAKLQTAFAGKDYEFSEDQGYEKQHCSLHALGPDTAPSKKHRWQVNVHAVDDENALDDLGSYLAKDLEAMVQPEDKFLVVIFDNGERYAY